MTASANLVAVETDLVPGDGVANPMELGQTCGMKPGAGLVEHVAVLPPDQEAGGVDEDNGANIGVPAGCTS